MSNQLKPCPFCGGDGGITTELKLRVCCSCWSCGARGPSFEADMDDTEDVKEAIEAAVKWWNRRAEE